ncbi:threonylcarbamoyl-AMP synthase [Candidatus Nomurabacteria bacterium]|uniref:L-threonylcarbamoyladenylate synthase n=1 Tax=Candidatus Dojkabacteria bacterium TaxID=2099670 RepID=A0A955KY52_9BACT|nr:threonylcarbamoyl-AMP synthase [Candidatus Dojkabacteria bacterium]MCB9790275.1 threonylcarbamoyl-AMP synthase [Candidatus Nomurabacteria bacterium]MCB9803204.1 threonylcarbamoyl-AMP synthase [Candidatus Nomurabacteria bacterium]
MNILKFSEKDRNTIIAEAVKTLNSGGIVVYPTETCYGIGVDATDQKAVDRLMEYKSRREGKPLSVAVCDANMASEYVEINDIAQNLYENYLPGPITVVSKGKGKVANGVESEYGTLGIRIPDHELILDIVRKLGRPVTSTSANMSYKPRPYSVSALLNDLPEKYKGHLDLIIDAGVLPKNDPSTVVDTTLNNMNVMRQGSLRFDQDINDDKLVLRAHTKNAGETIDFGSLVMLRYLDIPLKQPLILALRGDLGAGKTQFTKGIARYLKINETISSPTFTIIDEYDYNFGHHKGKLIHMDTWRVDGESELIRTGITRYLEKGNVIAVEWADKFYQQLLAMVEEYHMKILKVDFEYLELNERDIKVYDND